MQKDYFQQSPKENQTNKTERSQDQINFGRCLNKIIHRNQQVK